MSCQTILRIAIGLNLSGLLIFVWQFGLSSVCSILAFINFFVLVALHLRLQQFFNSALSRVGERNEARDKESALKSYLSTSRNFVQEANLAFSKINEIGQENFTTLIQGLSNESIRTSLLSANDKIEELRKRDNENNWIAHGISAVSSLRHQGNDTADYAFQVTSSIVKYIHASLGGFFLLRSADNDPHFELIAIYAFDKKRHVEKRINPGEGLIGQIYYEKRLIYITEVPKDYIKITSGLGEALPRCICIIPLLSEGKILGAVELAFFRTLQPAEFEYLNRIGDSIGYNLNTIESHRRTELLLAESQRMAQEVKSQEEELRQSVQELAATQKQMQAKQTEMDAVLSTLSTIELDINGNILQANEIFLGISGYSLPDIQGKQYRSLLPQHSTDLTQYEIMWNSILAGRSFSGEFRIVNKAQKEMWMAGNFTPIVGDAGHPCKVMVISLFTTQDKEKLIELQEMVTALKNCFPIAELNADLTFKSANDLFLTEIGAKRLELKKLSPRNVLSNGSFDEVEKYLRETQEQPKNIVLDIGNRNGNAKKFNSTLITVNNNNDKRRGLLILRNEL